MDIPIKLQIAEKHKLTRRTFLKYSGTIVFVMGTHLYLPGQCSAAGQGEGIPRSDGYLVVDVKKCQGCVSCMLACSLVHEGASGLSVSRIQILQDSFGKFPDDLTIEQCRQCESPACVKACPENALTADSEFGHVRMVDKEACTGCGSCFEACPFTPERLSVMADEAFKKALKSRKCDLCANAPYHWDAAGGGPGGKQACVEVCPVGAIAFTSELPVQEGTSGYKVNLREINWSNLGYGR